MAYNKVLYSYLNKSLAQNKTFYKQTTKGFMNTSRLKNRLKINKNNKNKINETD